MALILTKAQRKAVHRLWLRGNHVQPTYRQFRKTVTRPCGSDGYVMVRTWNMWLGIEQDGHTHS